MDAKEQLLQARQSLQSAVDKALEVMPEYRALQSVEEAIDALDRAEKAKIPAQVTRQPQGGDLQTPPLSYARLAIDALKRSGEPLTTPQIIEYIGVYRFLPTDPERAKINIASALSKEEELRSIGWKGGRAWWLTSEKVPLPRELDSRPPQG